MDIIIPHSWLKKFLSTKVAPKELAKYLSLCGPSIERTKKTDDGDFIYNIEVTTNRVDTASVFGIAREASSILPRFGIKAELIDIKLDDQAYKFKKNVKYLDVVVDQKLCSRFTAVLIRDVNIKESSTDIKNLLEKVGVRPINNIVDVSNYIMHELGQPVHTFDYDKIVNNKMILRESRKDESITTLDGNTFKLDGGDIVIEDGSGKLIDLCGIMGGENSAIDDNTKNVLLFVQNYNQDKIRKTSMGLGLRTEAAVLFEKGLDDETVKPAILSAIELIEKLSKGKVEREILDIYQNVYSPKVITTNKEDIDKIIGIDISKTDITSYLTNLGFGIEWNKNILKVRVPSYRASDISIKEDIVEEIARIYGYQNIPCVLMEGKLPIQKESEEFVLEKQIKNVLLSLNAIEVYNLSLVSKQMVNENALKLKNPLGADTEYLRTSLKPSLEKDILNNPQEKDYIHFFEVSNVYLPDEQLKLGGIIKLGKYRENKGIVETLLNELNINYQTKIEDGKDYLPNQRMSIYSNSIVIGEYGNLENGLFYYEFDLQRLIFSKKLVRKYKEVAKYPPQVEDLTLTVPAKTYIGDVISFVVESSPLISKAELKDIFNDSYTINIEYQDESKTLTDGEVETIRIKLLSLLNNKFGINLKS